MIEKVEDKEQIAQGMGGAGRGGYYKCFWGVVQAQEDDKNWS